MTCPSCQAENKDGAKFCSECGAPLALRCPRCGAAHRELQKFCDECGLALAASRLASEATATEPPESSPAPAPAEMRLVSVLFVDLVGFTSLSEGRDAEDVRELLGRYFDSARTIVERYAGTIEKFIGDAVMAVWGAPAAREDDAERAVRAALDLVDAVSVFGGEVGAPELRARAGVVTGQVAALENPGEGLVVGDRVNTASRVQSAAAPGSVLVDEVTRGVTSASIAYEDAGEHSVKGKAEPLRLWRAVRVVAGVAGSQREQGIEAPFVGRDGDLRLLKELFHAALERRSARLVAVFGEAGVGKSRLLREFSNYTDGLAGTVLWHSGRCLSYGEGVAYWALAEMVRQRFGLPEEASPTDAREKLDAGLARWLPEAADREFVNPRLGALIGVADPGLGREELFAGWRMLFERLAEHEPVALIFEDLQWADQGLLDFIDGLLDWSAASPIFVLALARPDLAARHPEWPTSRRAATTIALEPLDEAGMRELLVGVVPDLPAAAARQIVERAEGVPLYAVETLRALAARGVLADQDGRLSLAGELGELDVPASLGSLLAARIDALDPAERGLVKAMSVFGGSFPRATASALASVAEDELDAVLASLVRQQVLAVRADPLSPDRGQFTFAQGLLRSVAYEMLSRRERKARHLAAADHLGDAFPNDGEEVAEAIATHLLDAHRAAHGDPDEDELRARGVAALRRAAGRAIGVGAPEAAERAYLQARELSRDEPERTALTEAAAAAAAQAGHHERAVELIEEAIAAHRAGERERAAAALTSALSASLIRRGRIEDAVARIESALAVLGGSQDDADVGRLNAQLGRTFALLGRYEQAEPPLEAALRTAAALELPELLADALVSRAIALGYRGRVPEATALFGLANVVAAAHGLLELHQRSLMNLANVAVQWDLPEAERHWEASLELARRRGDRFAESMAACNLGAVVHTRGRWDEAQRLVEELEAAAPDRPGAEFVHWFAVFLEARRGRTEAAQERVRRGAALGESDDWEHATMFGAAEVVCHRLHGEHAAALDVGIGAMDDALAHVGVASDPVRYGWPEVVDSALALGRLDDARALVDRLAAMPRGHLPPFMRAELARARGRLAAAEGRHDEVEPDLRAAVDVLGALGYPYHLALAETDLARWLIEQGRSEEADALLASAAAALRGLGAAPALARAEALRETVAAERTIEA